MSIVSIFKEPNSYCSSLGQYKAFGSTSEAYKALFLEKKYPLQALLQDDMMSHKASEWFTESESLTLTKKRYMHLEKYVSFSVSRQMLTSCSEIPIYLLK